MSQTIAILCPGQGAQHANMFQVLGTEANTAMLEAWALDEALGQPLDRVLSDPACMYANRFAQPLLVAATLFAWEVVKSILPEPAIVAGYSIGELSSYAIAGSLSVPDAVRIAALRASYMDQCAAGQPAQAMIAVSGLQIDTVMRLMPVGQLHIAIEISENQFIVGGWADAALAFEKAIRDAGGHATKLPLEVASHTPLMHNAVQPMHELLQNSAFLSPRIPVVAGISAELVTNKEHALLSLSRQVAKTIRWKDCMEACTEASIAAVLELGPGAALAKMFQARYPEIPCRSVADFRTVDGLKLWLQRQMLRIV